VIGDLTLAVASVGASGLLEFALLSRFCLGGIANCELRMGEASMRSVATSVQHRRHAAVAGCVACPVGGGVWRKVSK
jgi:hypothetical protein